MAERSLPPHGWAYEYFAPEEPRLGRPVFRPIVPIGFASTPLPTLAGLVDSGSEHTLVARWLADDLGIDLRGATDRLPLGICGRTVEAVFAPTELRLHRDHGSDDYVSWPAEVQFTVTMNRRVLTMVVQDVETRLAR